MSASKSRPTRIRVNLSCVVRLPPDAKLADMATSINAACGAALKALLPVRLHKEAFIEGGAKLGISDVSARWKAPT